MPDVACYSHALLVDSGLYIKRSFSNTLFTNSFHELRARFPRIGSSREENVAVGPKHAVPEQGPANAAPVQFGVEGGAMRPPRVWIGLNVLKSRVDPGSPVRSR